MRRTRKWAFVQQEATRLAGLALSAAEISRRLDVDKSTVGRWIKAGKLSVKTRDEAKAPLQATGRQSPSEWSASVRQSFQLEPTDDQLVTLGERSLALSLNPRVSAAVRMTATRTFQGIVRQLALVARGAPAKTEAPTSAPAEPPPMAMATKNPVVRRPGGDPRKLLMAVK